MKIVVDFASFPAFFFSRCFHFSRLFNFPRFFSFSAFSPFPAFLHFPRFLFAAFFSFPAFSSRYRRGGDLCDPAGAAGVDDLCARHQEEGDQ